MGPSPPPLRRLAELRVSGYFGDKDMLALADLLCDAPAAEFAHLARLDFAGGERALRSHGAVALARVLLQGPPIQEVCVPWLPGCGVPPACIHKMMQQVSQLRFLFFFAASRFRFWCFSGHIFVGFFVAGMVDCCGFFT